MITDVPVYVAWIFVLLGSAATAACTVGALVRQRARR